MLLRYGLFALCSTLLMAQQSAIEVGVVSSRFPAGCSVTIDMKLSVIDADKMTKAGRAEPEPGDKQVSADAYSWKITHGDDGIKYYKLPSEVPIVFLPMLVHATGELSFVKPDDLTVKYDSPLTEVSFGFSPPLGVTSNGLWIVSAEGEIQLSFQGKTKVVPFPAAKRFEKDTRYCLYLDYLETKDNEVVFSARFLTLPELATLRKTDSEGKVPSQIMMRIPSTGDSAGSKTYKVTDAQGNEYDSEKIKIIDDGDSVTFEILETEEPAPPKKK